MQNEHLRKTLCSGLIAEFFRGRRVVVSIESFARAIHVCLFLGCIIWNVKSSCSFNGGS